LLYIAGSSRLCKAVNPFNCVIKNCKPVTQFPLERIDNVKSPAQPGTSQIQVFAWLLFAGIAVLFIIYGIYALILPSAQPQHWDFLTIDRDAVAYIGATFR